MGKARLNLGRGADPKEGYANCDLFPYGVMVQGASSPNNGVDMVFDLTEGLPFDADSIDEVMATQVLEHLERPTALLEEIYRVLKPGGLIDVMVPDLTIICKEWLEATDEQRWLSIGKWPPLYAWIWGRGDGANKHLCGFDKWCLRTLLQDRGFKDIEAVEPCQYLSVRLRGHK